MNAITLTSIDILQKTILDFHVVLDNNSAETLGEKLALESTLKPASLTLNLIFSVLVGLGFGWGLGSAEIGLGIMILWLVLFVIRFVKSRPEPNFLLAHDTQGFMRSLNLSDKTAIFDGSNIYHFGLDNRVGRMPLGALVAALRSEGYRIICFFDANIYFTLRENGEFPKVNRRFNIGILKNLFELEPSEIYVVPSGQQADAFVLETLSHLPISFAVTNDQFRDYAPKYDFLAKDNAWRKGVKMNGRNLLLYRHKFKYPLNIE